MLNIYLARHGEDQDNFEGILNGHRDSDLTETGIAQANSLASEIAKRNLQFDHIYSSPLQRAHKTAEMIAAKLAASQPVVWDELIERDFGIMTGKAHSSVEEMCAPDILHTENIAYFLKPEGGESFPELLERAKKILERVKQENDVGNILLVAHGDIGKMIFAAFYNLTWEEAIREFYFGNGDLLLLSESTTADKAHIIITSEHETEAQLKD